MSQIIKNLYLGDCWDVRLEKYDAVLNVSNNVYYEPLDKSKPFLRIPVWNEFDIMDKYLPDAIKFINENIKKGSVLVHCYKGEMRSASVVLTYLMTRNYSKKKAYNFLLKKRKQVFNCNSIMDNDGTRFSMGSGKKNIFDPCVDKFIKTHKSNLRFNYNLRSKNFSKKFYQN